MTEKSQIYIQRCFDLARLGKGNVAPNPLVGAVIVYNNTIIGEGFHLKYGSAHAEVNAVKSVHPSDRHFLRKSTLYVSLEPCCIHGNTPPCTDLILEHHFPKVVFSCIDQTAGVLGKSIRILEDAGVEVTTGIYQEQGEELVEPRTIFTTKNRPYIILKYAQSADGFIGGYHQPIWLTHPISKRLVHRWRSEVDAILVGTNTAAIDNPQLTNRLYYGKSPLRIVLDRNNTLNTGLHLLDQQHPTWVVSEPVARKGEPSANDKKNLRHLAIPFDKDMLPKLLQRLHHEKYGILMVEGGLQVLKSFIELGLWDEARVFEVAQRINSGVEAPRLLGDLYQEWNLMGDRLKILKPFQQI